MAQTKKQAKGKKHPKWKALNYLIRNGYIVEEQTIAEVQNNRQLDQLVAIYQRRNPGVMRGKGNAFTRIVTYINSAKGGKGSLRGVASLINELELAGKLSGTGKQQKSKSSRKQNDMLKAAEKLAGMKSVNQAEAFASILNTVQGIQYSPKAFEFYAKPFLENSEGVVEWSNIVAVLLQNLKGPNPNGPQLWGPARLALRQLQVVIQRQTQALASRLTYAQDPLSDDIKQQAAVLKANVTNFISGCISAFESVKALADGYNTGSQITNSTQLSVGSGVDAANKFSMAELKAMPITNKAEMELFITDTKILMSEGSSFAHPRVGVFANLRRDMATRQSLYGDKLFQNQLRGVDIAPKGSLAEELMQAARTLAGLRNDGKIDGSQYSKLRTKFYKFIKSVESLKVPEGLSNVRDIKSGNVQLATVKYKYAILQRQISQFNKEISNAALVDSVLSNSAIKDKSRRALLNELMVAFNQVKDNFKSNEAEEQKAFPDPTTRAANSIAAMKAVNVLSNTIDAIKNSSSDKDARIIVARLFLNDKYKAGWSLAKTLGALVGVKSFQEAAKKQQQAYAKAFDPSHVQQQIKSSFAVEPESFYKLAPLNASGISTAVKTATQKFWNLKHMVGGKKIGFIGLEIPQSQDPRIVLGSLPAAVQKLSSDHVKARAWATQQFLAELVGSYTRLMAAVVVPEVGGVDLDSQSSVFKNHMKLFKQALAEAKYDSTYKNAQVNANGGLQLAGFISDIMGVAEFGKSSLTQVPFAILASYDLLAEPVFRGDTLYPPTIGGSSPNWTTTYQGDSLSSRSAYAQMITKQGGQDILTSRRFIGDLGEAGYYPWSPVDAAELRGRYYISLYPFKLAGKMKKLFDQKMAILRGDAPIQQQAWSGDLADVAASFSS